MGPSPTVTGISPKEGPPGTRVTIRGEYLGQEPNDIVGLTICDCDCLLSAEWKSSNKITARSGPGKGRGDIIITTRSGGRGTCTVQFRGYYETIGPLKESAVWVEEAPLPGLSWGHRSLSHSTFHLEDPLGLSVEENEKKFPEDDLHEMFPDGCGDLTAENFEPNWFLLEHHHATSFADLKVGLAFLKRKVEGHREGQLSFLKDNVSSIMEVMDTLFILKEKFDEDMKRRKTNSIVKIDRAMNDSLSEAKKLFEDVLSRREKADAARHALAVMTRYKFLFFLPLNIEHNIKHGDFDLVMSDYARARNLFEKFETPVFKQILNDVASTIENLKLTWNAKLKDMPCTVEQQKKIIRNLVILGFEGDPGWNAICYTYKYIKDQLYSSREKYVNMESAQLDAESGKHKMENNAQKHKRTPSGNLIGEIQTNTPPRISFIEDIVHFLLQFFVEFWKLGQAYFNGELQIKPDKMKPNEFKHYVVSIIKFWCSLIRSAILPQNVDKELQWTHYSSSKQTGVLDIVTFWLPHCIRLVQSLHSSLTSMDIPNECNDIMVKLLLDLRIHNMIIHLKKTANQVKSLNNKENWQLDYDSEFGAVTQLPGEFEKLVTESVQRIKESTVETERKELSILTNVTAKQELTNLTNQIFLNFVQTLEVLGMTSEDHDHTMAVSQLIGTGTTYANDSSELTWEQRLLAMLSNCRYTRIFLYPKLSAQFRHHGFPSIDESIQQCNDALSTLEKRMIETYLELKSDPLVGTIEPSMYLGHFEWDTCSKPTDLRPYVKEILTNITAVYAEVHRLVPKLLYRIISQIVETVAEELSRLMSCVTKFNNNGKIQARIDITGLRNVLHQFTTDNAKCYFNEALEAVPHINEADNKIVEEVMNLFTKKIRLQLVCFTAALPTDE